METVPIRTSVTAREAIKKLVGWRIWRSTTKLTRTSKFPKVVMTMHMANPTAITIVAKVLNGAGQHSGPQGVGGRPPLVVTVAKLRNILA